MPEPTRLEDLCLERRCFEFLRDGLGLTTLDDLLASPPEAIARRVPYARAVARALTRYEQAARFRQALLERPPKPERPATLLEQALAILTLRREPITLRHLKDQIVKAGLFKNLVTLERELQEHPDVLFYPFSHHRWVGLRSWGEAGVRAAALASWTLLPVHLQTLRRHARTAELKGELYHCLLELADERDHREILRLLSDWDQTAARPEKVREAPAPVYLKSHLFEGLEPTRPVVVLAAPVARKLASLKAPRSLCQLKVSPADLEWLREWAAGLKTQPVISWLEGVNACFDVGGRIASQRECFGLLFMLLASEVARRETSEGQLWNVVHPLFSPPSRLQLFVQGQPRGPLRQALESACRRFQLHHAFGVEGAQSWYQSVFLQFGFTRQGIAKLPIYLSVEEAQSVAVSTLRKVEPEFQTLWQALSQHRDRRTPETRARAVATIQESPFVLPEWQTELLKAALEACPQSQGCRETGEEVAYPLLRWEEGSHPEFVARPTRLFSELVDPAYTLMHDDEPVARLFLEPEGHYLSDPGELSFRPRHNRVRITLEGDGGEDVRDLELELWDAEELYTAYDLKSGERMGELTPGRPCALLLAEGVTLEPAAPRSSPCGNSGYRLHRLPEGLTVQHRLLSDNQELANVSEPPRPDWAREIVLAAVQDRPAELPCRVTLDLRAPPGVTVRWARFERQTVAMTALQHGVWRGQVLLEPDLPTTNLRLHFGLERQGQKTRVSCSARVRLQAVTAWLGGHWEVLKRRPRLLVREAREGSFRVFTGDEPQSSFGLIEGDVFSTRARPGTRSLGRLAGFGGELCLRQGPYNAGSEGPVLAQSVEDRGIIKGFERCQEGFELRLAHPVEADERHMLVWWDGQRKPEIQGAARLEATLGTKWTGPSPITGPVCLALGYDGVRLGTLFDEEVLLTDEPERTAGMLRWLHLPLLAKGWLEPTRKLAHAHPTEFLTAWLASERVKDVGELRFEAELSEWFSVVRQVFRGWNPNDDTVLARRVLNRVQLEDLLRVSPFLLARLARAAWNAERLAEVQRELAGCDSPARLPAELQGLEEQAWRTMGVDPAFVTALVRRVEQLWRGRGSGLDRREQLNLGLAIEVAPFRRALAVRLLTSADDPVPSPRKPTGPRFRLRGDQRGKT